MVTYEELKAANIAQKELIDSLQRQIKELQKLIFGSKAERFISDTPPEQLGIFSDTSSEAPAPVEKEKISYERTKAKKHPGRDKLPDHLPVEEIIIEPEGDMKGTEIGRDITETLKYTPASLVRLRTIRPRRAYTDEEGVEKIIQAPPRSRPLPKSIAEASLLAHILVCKFIDHLPFYRQIQRFKRDYDWILNKSTVNDWFIAVCTLLDPLYQSMVRRVLASTYIQADESHIKVQDGDKKGATHMGWQWVYHAPTENIVVFQYRKGRGKNGPKEFLENYSGYLQCDGYGVYDKIGLSTNIGLIGCHVHARRYFVNAKEAGDNRADFVLNIYQEIYRHERQCRDMSVGDRRDYRNQHLAPKLEELKVWLDEKTIVVLPKSQLGKAINYTLRQWKKLIMVLEDGRLELDNNLIENKIRSLALGRKNYLFAGSHAAAQRIAMMYTFFATCQANNVNPYKWLKHTLEVVSDCKVNDLNHLIPNKDMFQSSVN